jgi:hypothetical protein
LISGGREPLNEALYGSPKGGQSVKKSLTATSVDHKLLFWTVVIVEGAPGMEIIDQGKEKSRPRRKFTKLM